MMNCKGFFTLAFSALLAIPVLSAAGKDQQIQSPQLPEHIQLWEGRDIALTLPGDEKEKEVLYKPETLPGIEIIGNVKVPSMYFYPASGSNKARPAVVICPGGGYELLAIKHEGTDICAWLNTIGVHAFLLKYRTPNREEAALADAARAIRVIRSRAKELHVDPDKIGVIGFSAGGNLAARVSAPDRDEPYEQKDGIDKLNFRPNFAMLIYPAYLTDLRKLFDMELKTKVKVDKRTPPTFIVQTQDDGIKVENALAWYIQLRKAGVSIEMHLFPNGGHGYGIMRRGMSVDIWPDLAYRWMKTIKLNIH